MGLDICGISFPPVTLRWPHRRDEWLKPGFENYRTVAFELEQMLKLIGTGTPLFDFETGAEFRGWDTSGRDWRGRWPEPHPATVVQLGVWLDFVPEIYHDDVLRAPNELLPHYQGLKLVPQLVAQFTRELHEWIGWNVDQK